MKLASLNSIQLAAVLNDAGDYVLQNRSGGTAMDALITVCDMIASALEKQDSRFNRVAFLQTCEMIP